MSTINILERMEKAPEEYKKIGGFLLALNSIDILIVTLLSAFFTDTRNVQAEKNLIINEALWDIKIFPSFENRMELLIKSINNMARFAEENNISFPKEEFLNTCKDIKKVQSVRNKLAHQTLIFPGNGKIAYRVRKSNEERLHDLRENIKKGTLKEIEINIDKELEFAQRVLDATEKLLTDFLTLSSQIQN